LVGWYTNANLYDDIQQLPGRGSYNFRARTEDARLLPPEQRMFRVPTGRGAIGQSNVFYSLMPDGTRRDAPWIEQVLRHIENHDEVEAQMADATRALGQGIGLSATDRAKVELHAMKVVEQHYRDAGYEVEIHGRPFDLLCRRGRKELRVEVKGTTGEGRSVLVTNGEVESARVHDTEMFIVSDIKLTSAGACGGREQFFRWNPTDDELQAKVFQYTVPKRR
jgi:hypothetical protein